MHHITELSCVESNALFCYSFSSFAGIQNVLIVALQISFGRYLKHRNRIKGTEYFKRIVLESISQKCLFSRVTKYDKLFIFFAVLYNQPKTSKSALNRKHLNYLELISSDTHSTGYCILVAHGLHVFSSKSNHIIQKMSPSHKNGLTHTSDLKNRTESRTMGLSSLAATAYTIIIAAMVLRTISRNEDWKDRETLFR